MISVHGFRIGDRVSFYRRLDTTTYYGRILRIGSAKVTVVRQDADGTDRQSFDELHTEQVPFRRVTVIK